jgi:transketolase
MKAMRDVFGDTLTELGNFNSDILVLDADLANSTKAEKFAQAHPSRFLQMGIAEQNMVGVAAGLASYGFVPWVSSFAVFFTHRAIDPIRVLVAQTHANVKIGAAYTGLMTGSTGKTHQDVQDLAIMRAMPGMTILAPADATECEAMIRWATEFSGPVYLRVAREATPALFGPGYCFVPGRTYQVRTGTDVLLVSTGPQTVRCVEAVSLLEQKGISAGLLHVPSIKPLNTSEVLEAVSSVELVVTVEEHTVLGGLGSLIAEIISQEAPRRIVRLGIEDRWGESAPNDFLLDRFGLSSSRVRERVESILRGSQLARLKP